MWNRIDSKPPYDFTQLTPNEEGYRFCPFNLVHYRSVQEPVVVLLEKMDNAKLWESGKEDNAGRAAPLPAFHPHLHGFLNGIREAHQNKDTLNLTKYLVLEHGTQN